MYTQTKKEKTVLIIKAIKVAYKARKLSRAEAEFLLKGTQELL